MFDVYNMLLSKARVAGVNLFCKGIVVREKCFLDRRVILNTYHGGRIEIGRGTMLMEGVILDTYGGDIVIGKDCSINPYCVLYGHGGLKIGNYVRVAAGCVIIPNNHLYERKEVLITAQGNRAQGIEIEDDVWIGTRSVVLDGVKVARGSVIGAGSVVTKSTKEYGVYVGTPARLKKTRK